MPNELTTPPTAADGRRRRSERSRAAIVDALLDLLRSGEVRPSSTAVAAQAGLTQRTVFNHFADMDELLAAAAERQGQRIRALLPEATDGDLEVRAGVFATQLATLLEDTMHVRWAVLVHDVQRAGGIELVRWVHQLLRHQLTISFSAELAALPARQRAQVLDSFDLLADAGVWRIRRLQHEQSFDQGRAAIERSLLALLRSP